jgi:small nuclear ribonucleoprotein (snRNP)-like protein
MPDPLERLLNQQVILDTETPIVYIGRLIEITEHVFVLDEADMHDCRDGHANKEVYLAEAHQHGMAVNRREVVVMRSVVISVSRLKDVVAE